MDDFLLDCSLNSGYEGLKFRKLSLCCTELTPRYVA
jgi:hypothetical protein